MSRNNDLKKLIVNYERRLQRLEEQQASLGFHTPPHILNEIDDIKTAIEELQTELKALESNGVNEESLRVQSKLAQDTIPKRRVKIYIEGNISSLSAERQSAAIDGFAGAIGISRQDIEVYRVYSGSIVFDLGIPPYAVEHLRSRLSSNNAQLRLLKVEKVILERRSGETEEWVIKEGKYSLVTSSSGIHGISQRVKKSLLILEDLLLHLPAIQDELGEKRWPTFAQQVREQKASFETLADDQSLIDAANQLLRLFLGNEIGREVITRPDTGQISRIRLPKPQAGKEIHLETRPNVFQLFEHLKEGEALERADLALLYREFCRDPDTFAKKVRAFLDQQSRDR